MKAKTAFSDDTPTTQISDLVAHCHKTIDRGHKFVRRDMGSTRLMLFTDAACSNVIAYSSKIGFVIPLVYTERYIANQVILTMEARNG